MSIFQNQAKVASAATLGKIPHKESPTNLLLARRA